MDTLDFPIRSDRLRMTASVREVVYTGQTPYQRVDIVETDAFGRALLLDGHIQLTTFDEAAYHEALVHVPLMAVREPRRALVIGGGDGGVLRELCRHAALIHIDMVEIDQMVVDACRAHLPSLNAGSFDDPRVNLVIGDAFDFAATATGGYDLIVVDATDVYEEEDGSLSEMLFTEKFYRDLRSLLSEDGFVVTQADNLVFCPYSLDAIRTAFEAVFHRVGSYFTVVPSFGGFSGYCWASRGNAPAERWTDVVRPLAGLRALTPAAYDYGMSRLPFGDR